MFCNKEVESIDHMMIQCSFTKMMWHEEKIEFKIAQKCVYQPLSLFFLNWINGANTWKALLCYVCWKFWKNMNGTLFKGKPKRVGEVSLEAI